MFLFIQEHWLPNHEAMSKFSTDFPNYVFITTSSDMFMQTEDRILKQGATWHGTALAWPKHVDMLIVTLPIISDRFCGIKYEGKCPESCILAYTVYLPTAGRDDDFLEILSLLSHDLHLNMIENGMVILGMDSNQSKLSFKRRTEQ